jgi:hypothetical protein
VGDYADKVAGFVDDRVIGATCAGDAIEEPPERQNRGDAIQRSIFQMQETGWLGRLLLYFDCNWRSHEGRQFPLEQRRERRQCTNRQYQPERNQSSRPLEPS